MARKGKKKILFVSPTGTLDNGAEISVFYLMRHLSDLGYEVHNVTVYTDARLSKDYGRRYAKCGVRVHFLNAQKWWWEEAPGVLDGTPESRAESFRNNIAQIRRLIRREGIACVVSNTVNVFQGAVAAACDSVPHYWMIHEFPMNEFAYYRDKVDFVDEYSDRIYGVAGSLHAALQELMPHREVKDFVSFVELKRAGIKAGKRSRIVSVGRLTERKNQLELMEAYRKLGRPDVELVFIGDWDEDYMQRCNRYIAENNLSNITFAGHKENPWGEVTDKDICVLTSAMETFGLVYVEALLNGVPVIVSDNPGYRSVRDIFGAGTMYTLGDTDGLAVEMGRMLDGYREEKAAALGRVPAVVEKYAVADAYRNITDDLGRLDGPKMRSVRHIANIVGTTISEK